MGGRALEKWKQTVPCSEHIKRERERRSQCTSVQGVTRTADIEAFKRKDIGHLQIKSKTLIFNSTLYVSCDSLMISFSWASWGSPSNWHLRGDKSRQEVCCSDKDIRQVHQPWMESDIPLVSLHCIISTCIHCICICVVTCPYDVCTCAYVHVNIHVKEIKYAVC